MVVADTTPLRYLIAIHLIDLLPNLYGEILIPEEVWSELRHPSAPALVKAWAQSPPGWIKPSSVANTPVDPFDRLDSGERAAIMLAIEQKADLVLMDDRQGRIAAIASGLEVRGTIGILIQAAAAQMIDLRTALNQLAATNFHITKSQTEDALRSIEKASP